MTKTRPRPSRWPWFLAFAALLACGDDGGTGPEDRLQLTPGQAAPFALVEVDGLPDEYAATPRLDITVGGQPSVLVYDADDQVHRLVVPDLAPGRADVVIPGVQGGRERTATLEVTARHYAGGTPDAAIAQMNTLLDSMQVSVSYGLAVVDADSAIYGRMNAFLTVAEGFQTQLARLSPQDRATVAAIFSVTAPDFAVIVGQMTAGLEELRAQPPILGSLASAAIPVSASSVVARCVDYQQTLRNIERIADVMDDIATVANAIAWLGGPAARGTVGILTYAMTFTMDLATIIANSVPRLIDPDGLRLQVHPARLRHNGGQGAMTAWVRRRASGEVLGSVIGTGMGLADVAEGIRRFNDARKRIDWKLLGELVGSEIKDQAIDEALDWIDATLSDFLADHILPSGEVQVTLDGATFTAGHPSNRWEFTGAAGSVSRAMRTLGQNQQPVETFQVAARIGSAQGCTAATGAANPSLGLNGFEIATATRVRFLAPAQGVDVNVPAGSSVVASIPVANQGTEQSGALTYRLQYANGLSYTPPAWLTVSAPSGPSRLAASAQNTVRVTVRAASDALQQQVVVPVAVLEDGKVVDNAWVRVSVQPQLSDITVNRSPSTLRLWDHGQQDGDIITVTLNGAPVVSGMTLTNAGTFVPVEYRRGRNVLIVRAHNEGSLRPNTASLGFASVVRGPATQAYELSTGETTQLVITYDPAATPSAAADLQVPPAPAFTRCAPGQRGDCLP
jgi:hypothetical protein